MRRRGGAAEPRRAKAPRRGAGRCRGCNEKKDPISVDIFDKIPEVKREFLKFCKSFEARLRRNVQTHRVIPQVVGLRCGTHCILDGIYCC